MNPFSAWRFLKDLWNKKSPRRPVRRKDSRRSTFRLHLEALEERTVMSTLPTPLISDQFALIISDQFALIAGANSAQIAVDPFDPQRIVAVAGAGVGPVIAAPATELAGRFTTDGGDNWSSFAIPRDTWFNGAIPATVNRFANVADPSVSFDRFGHFYVAAIEYDGDIATRTQGQVIVHTFDFLGSSPDHIDESYVYRWSGQDPAYNTVVAVDSNAPSYVDPEFPAIQLDDTMSNSIDNIGGRDVPRVVYVAFNTNWNTSGSQVLIAASPFGNDDQSGGTGEFHPFTTVQRVSSLVTPAEPIPRLGAAPQILFTQESPNGDIAGGLLGIFYQNTGGGIMADFTRPDNGNPNVPLATTHLFDGTGGTFADAAAGGPDIPSFRDFTITVTQPAGMTEISDMDVRIRFRTHDNPNYVAGSLAHMSFVLTPPTGSPLASRTLIRNRTRTDGTTNTDGNGVPVGVAGGTNLGVDAGDEYIHITFDDDAPRTVGAAGFVAPYAGHFRPEGNGFVNGAGNPPGGVNFFSYTTTTGRAIADFLGDWTLTITDFRNNALPAPPPAHPSNILYDWQIQLTGIIQDGLGLNDPVMASAPVAASEGSIFSVTQDTTVGAYSLYSGRIYIAATTGGGTDRSIAVVSSDEITQFSPLDNLPIFGASVSVNDDALTDNFSEGRRDQYMPTLSVDRSTGTLVITYNDARWDAANLRYSTMISTSLDGGDTFAESTYLNRTKLATDFLTSETIEIEPIPGNNGTNATIGPALGRRNALFAYRGEVLSFFGSNLNNGLAQVWTAQVTIAAGPRVVFGDMGQVLTGSVVFDDQNKPYYYNNTIAAADGTRQLTGFVVEFDRPIDPSTFGVNDIAIQYQDPNTSVTSALNAGSIVVLDGLTLFGSQSVGGLIGGNPTLATRFLVLLQDPQNRVGTYSYAVGPLVRDRMRDISPRLLPGTVASWEPPGVQKNLTLPAGSGTTTNSSLTVAGMTPTRLRDLTVEVNIQHPRSPRLEITLIAPGGLSVLLWNEDIFGTGSNFTSTLFDEAAPELIDQVGLPPFTGRFRPFQRLEDIIENLGNVNGTWQLRVRNFDTQNSGILVNWKLNLQTGTFESVANGFGNFMDQNQDAHSADGIRENAVRGFSGDRFAVPNPVSGVPFQLPYTVDSLPFMIPGPHIELARNEVQYLTITATGGTFTLDFAGQQTGNLAFNISAANLRGALDALSTGGLGNFNVTKTGSTYRVEFQNSLGYRDVPEMIPDDALLTGPGADAQVLTLIPGTTSVTVTGGKQVNGENVIVNGSVNQLRVEFDRLINASTFTSADVLEIISPYGRITSNFTVTPVGVVGGATKVFLIGLPAQQTLSGSYSVVLGPDIQDTFGNKIDSNLNAGLFVLQGTDPSRANFDVGVFATGAINLTLNPGQTLISTLNVPSTYLIDQNPADFLKHIQVLLNITHPNVRNLTGALIAPDNTTIQIFGNLGTFTSVPFADIENATLDDFGITPIQDGNAPFNNGPYKPQQPLSTLLGRQALGLWQLAITNTGSSPGTLENWQLRLPKILPGTGLGEAIGDRSSFGFRIFVSDTANVNSTTAWTPIGGESNSVGFTGRVGAIALDPSDPSGNTVYAAGATGGIWKTFNFLTTNPHGPTWVPLTDLGPTHSLNVSHLAVYGRNNDPGQSIIIASTGDDGELSSGGSLEQRGLGGPPVLSNTNRYPGVGFLISFDGGVSWKVLDSTSNADSNGIFHSINAPPALRNRLFVGSKVHKVVIDPTPLSTGELAMYAAVSGSAAQQGIWRSLDTARTWFRVRAGDATDVALAEGSRGSGGQLTILYAAFQGDGVYMTTSALSASTMTAMLGGQGVPQRRDYDGVPFNPPELLVAAPANTPTGNKGRILLATPALTNVPLQDTFYQGWVYALVMGPTGFFDGLYVTKDFGLNWTDLKIPIHRFVTVSGTFGYPTNDEAKVEYDIFSGMGNIISSITIDPNDPNVVYLGGWLQNRSNTNPQIVSGLVNYSEAFIRVDISTLSDPYALVAYDNSDNVAGGPTQFSSTGAARVKAGGAPYGILNTFDQTLDPRGDYYNLMRDPTNPFLNPATQLFSNVPSSLSGLSAFTNAGDDIRWAPFNDFWTGAVPPDRVFVGWVGHGKTIAVTDQFTGKTRLIVGSGDGVYTAVDDGSGGLLDGVGYSDYITGSRTGNLSFTQFTAGALQPSSLAADLANAVFYGMAVNLSITTSGEGILTDGNIDWTSILGGGEAIHVDPTGSGQTYQFRWPQAINQLPFVPTDFFIITPPGANPTSRISGLLQAGDNPGQTNPVVGQWPPFDGSNFAVSPVDNLSIVISSQAGRIFRTTGPLTGGGIQWFVIGDPANLDSSYAQALAFGAPSSYPTSNPADVIYAGTRNGNVFATYTGGGYLGSPNWKALGSPDGTPIMSIVANPKPNSRDIYVVTRDGVWYMANTETGPTTWVNIAGNLFSPTLTRPMFNDNAEQITTLRPSSLTDLIADWRFAVPDNLAIPTGPAHPVLYVSGTGGVFRSIDKGATWSYFPGAAQNVTQVGGWLPNIEIRDLALANGNNNPNSGFPDQATGFNMLAAFSYGHGAFAIRLDNSDVAQYLAVPNSGPKVASIAAISPIPGNMITGITVTFEGAVDPGTFTTADVLTLTGPGGAIIPMSVVDVTSPGPNQPNLHNVYNINFPTALGAGTYTLKLGTDIRDYSGNKMNMDGDNLNGEIPADEFNGSFVFNPNQPPTIENITDKTTQPGTVITIPFTVGDDNTPPGSLIVTGLSRTQDQAIVPNANITFGGSGANRTVIITPNQTVSNITVTITITVTDSQTLSANDSFNLTYNTKPTLPVIPDLLLPPPSAYTSTVTATDPDAPPQTIQYGISRAATSLTAQAYSIDQAFNLAKFPDAAGYRQNTHNANEQYVYNPSTGIFYYLLPNGELHQVGTLAIGPLTDSVNGPLIATLAPVFWMDPRLLHEAKPAIDPIAAGVTVSMNVDTGAYGINVPSNFLGVFQVTISATDYNGAQQLDTVTQSFYVGVFNEPPTLNPLANQIISPTQVANFDADGNPNNAGQTLTYSASLSATTLAQQIHGIDKAFGLTKVEAGGGYRENLHVPTAKWIYSPSQDKWYYLLDNGNLYRYDGGDPTIVPAPFATLDPIVWQDPRLLHNAAGPFAPQFDPNAGGVAVTINSSTGVGDVNPPPNFATIFRVTVKADDTIDSTTQSFLVGIFNDAPALATIDDVTTTPGTPLNLNAVGSDPNNTDPNNPQPLTYSISQGVSALAQQVYSLDQTYNLDKHPDAAGYRQNTHNADEKYVYNPSTNAWYYILTNGELHAVGSSSSGPLSDSVNGPLIATLSPIIWQEPSLLHDALPAQDPNSVPIATSIGAANGAISIIPLSSYRGIFAVTVTVSDELLTASQTFNVGVANHPVALDPILDQLLLSSSPLTLNPAANDPDPGQSKTWSLSTPSAYAVAYQVDQMLNLEKHPDADGYRENLHGGNEKWLWNPNNGAWYYLLQNGELHGVGTPLNGPLIGTLNPIFWERPQLLHDADVPQDPVPAGVQANINPGTGQITVQAPATYRGVIQLTVNVSDSFTTSSRTFLVGIYNDPPVVPAISDKTIVHTEANVPGFNVGATDPNSPPQTLTYEIAQTTYSTAYDTDQTYNLAQYPDSAGYRQNLHHGNEKWLWNPSNGDWFYLLPNGELHRVGTPLNGPLVAMLAPIFWDNPALLHDARVPQNPNAIGVNTIIDASGNVIIDPPNNYAGIFQVTVTVRDRASATSQSFASATSQSFLVNVTNSPPTLGPDLQDKTMSTSQDTITVDIGAADADNDDPLTPHPLTPTVGILTGQNQAYLLDQEYGFFQDDANYFFNTYNQQEKWLATSVNGPGGGNHYAIFPNGDVFFITNDPANPFGAKLTTLSTAYYNDPSLLWNASESGQATPTFTRDGNSLTLNPPDNFDGFFDVTITAFDGIDTIQQTFRVTVNP